MDAHVNDILILTSILIFAMACSGGLVGMSYLGTLGDPV